MDKLGHLRLIDVTPTLCHLLGIQPPAQSQGSIAYDLFEGHQMVRERPKPTPAYGPTKEYKQRMQSHLATTDASWNCPTRIARGRAGSIP